MPLSIHRNKGGGIVNAIIDKLPVELHLPGYNWCGPGTHVGKRLARGDQGINLLDQACKSHDLVYHNTKDSKTRKEADLRLAERAWERVKAKDSSLGEKVAAFGVTNAMKLKTRFGGSCGLKYIVHQITRCLKKKGGNLSENINRCLIAARRIIKKKKPKKTKIPRVLPIPKKGGVLPLIPIFAALSALGSIATGASNIAKAISDTKLAKKKLEENKKHNAAMEGIKIGSGVFLKPYKRGYGIYLEELTGNGGLKKKKSLRF